MLCHLSTKLITDLRVDTENPQGRAPLRPAGFCDNLGGLKLRFEPVHRACLAAVEAGAAPGFVVGVAQAGQTLFREAFGSRQIVPRLLPAQADTVYDVASLTKAVVTSVLCMQEVAAGRLRLDAPAVEGLPELAGSEAGRPGLPGGARAAITWRHLLAHASGLPAHRPFWRRAAEAPSGRLAVAWLAAREPLLHPPGVRAVYSDLGFILLGWWLERSTGQRLDELFAGRIAAPLGLASARFVSLADPDARAELLARRSVAATQVCTERRRLMLGEVDDLNAAAMEGIAGHAGLFSDADDLLAIARALTAAWRGEAAGLVPRDVVREFWTPSGVPASTWRLGWDGPAATGSQAGDRLSRGAVGHLGFTGCSVWIDPERELAIVLLANRVHPSVPADDRFRRFRPALHDAVLEALGYDCR
jgi:CubicO group peptidase (beta-lactamase class C family)